MSVAAEKDHPPYVVHTGIFGPPCIPALMANAAAAASGALKAFMMR